ncbi:MAG: VOC family protein [Planctomycetales bacterium]|nr:VOC family protein [Planctomycetales bacterium]
MRLTRLDHVQVAIPKGKEPEARAFYGEVLGLREIPKPPELAGRGGLWFQLGDVQIHLGSDAAHAAPSPKAHLAFHVEDLEAARARLRGAGARFEEGPPIPGAPRFFVFDPFGFRLEFQQAAHVASP